jgi:hypothetical protein
VKVAGGARAATTEEAAIGLEAGAAAAVRRRRPRGAARADERRQLRAYLGRLRADLAFRLAPSYNLKGFHPAHILHLFDHEILINKRCEFSHQTYSTPPTQSEQQSVNQWLHGYSLTSCNDRNTHSRYGTVLRLDLYTRCSVLTIPMRTVFICGESNHTDTLFTRNSYSITLHHKIHSWPGS